jgi:hypothetical protein
MPLEIIYRINTARFGTLLNLIGRGKVAFWLASRYDCAALDGCFASATSSADVRLSTLDYADKLAATTAQSSLLVRPMIQKAPRSVSRHTTYWRALQQNCVLLDRELEF